ncbi:xanthine dehydrogenase family protein molybdopterin-binding subunit [Streptomyces sp. NPDC001941]|uniref:xanthine dehydrogenase family protein molybdopterin-binding subunit n=1 Tax=Streptomyces sp. NPDC001941 TaxID=3154659 RepID=UPI00332BE8CC
MTDTAPGPTGPAPHRPQAPVEVTNAPYVGRSLDRVDGPAKTSGAARYTADVPLDGLAHGALVHATVSRGRIIALDTEEAAAVPGVLAVLTYRDAPAVRPGAPGGGVNVDCLGSDAVHWDGQPVAVAVAETPEAAHEAARLVRVRYHPLPAAVRFDEEGSRPVARERAGDVERGLGLAAVRFEAQYSTAPQHHNALEPHTSTAAWDGDRLTVHDTTQHLDGVRAHLAHAFRLPPERVRVVAAQVGGGFGGKIAVWPVTVLAARAARAVGRPVRIALTREGVYRSVGGRAPSHQSVALGADRDGVLTALAHSGTTRTARVGGDPDHFTAASALLYGADHLLLHRDHVTRDVMANTAMRAPGEAVGSFALESAMDELAHRTGFDPVELRLRNEPDRAPLDGRRYTRRGLAHCLAQGAREFGWAGRDPRPGVRRWGRWLVGTGAAAAYHPSWLEPARVSVRLAADGTVLVRCAFHEIGVGGATAHAQIAADALGVPFDAVRVEHGDTLLPTGPCAGGSAQTAAVAAGVLAACARVREAVGAGRPLPYEVVVDTAPNRVDALLERVRARARVRAASGAHFCEVRVDADTGETRVTRWLGVFDIGTVVNAKTAASQLRGGIVMGIGQALMEETLHDPRTGRIMNAGLVGYHVPVHGDIPPITVHFLDEPDPTMPLGILGAGELGITGAAAAVANAVHHATGTRVRDLPLTPEKLL